MEEQYQFHHKSDTINGCVDPRVIFSTVGEGAGHSSEEEEEWPHPSSGIKGGRDENSNDRYLCLACHVRKHHACTCDSDNIPTPPFRPAAASACINITFYHFNVLNIQRNRKRNG